MAEVRTQAYPEMIDASTEPMMGGRDTVREGKVLESTMEREKAKTERKRGRGRRRKGPRTGNRRAKYHPPHQRTGRRYDEIY